MVIASYSVATVSQIRWEMITEMLTIKTKIEAFLSDIIILLG